MKEKVEQLAEGIFEYELPKLLISEEKLTVTVETGGEFSGQFVVSNSEQKRMKGVVYSDSIAFQLENNQFVGEEGQISFHYSAGYAKAGEHFSGNLSIVTDIGEVSLPYEISVTSACFHTDYGKVKDLFQFASLAKTDWKTAEELFYSDRFESILFSKDDKYRVLYRTLRKHAKKNSTLEEFLLATGKKTQISVEPEKKQITYTHCEKPFSDRLNVHMKGWGYAEYSVLSDREFLVPNIKSISSFEAEQHTAVIEYSVDLSDYADGVYTANLILLSDKKEIQIPIVCNLKKSGVQTKEGSHKTEHATVRLIQNYLDFCFGEKTAKQYLSDAEMMIMMAEENASADWKRRARLYRLHLWNNMGKDSSVRNALSCYEEEQLASLSDDPVSLAAYYYLSSLQKRPRLPYEETIFRLKELERLNPDSPAIMWFLLYSEKKYTDVRVRYAKVRDFSQGITASPILLFEAALALREDPSLLKELGRFELLLLEFMVKHRFLNDGVRRQMTYLAGREKTLKKSLFRILIRAYYQKADKDLLSAICTLIVRNSEKGAKYYPWLKLGVEQQIKITELMEYYMYSIPEEGEELHPSAYLYFQYDNELNAKRKALLYASLIRNRNSYQALFRTYRDKIEQFAKEQMRAGNISRNLAVIYQGIFAEGFPEGDYLEAFPVLNFTYELKFPGNRFSKVCVSHGEKQEMLVPFRPDGTLVTIYSPDAEVFLVDEKEHYIPLRNLERKNGGDFEISLTRILSMDALLLNCFEQGSEELCLLSYFLNQLQYHRYTDKETEIYERLVRCGKISETLRNYCIKKLMHHYYDNFEMEAFEFYLKQVDIPLLEAGERCGVIHQMIVAGYDDKVYEALSHFGLEGLDARKLVKYLDRVLTDLDKKDDVLLEAVRYVFDCGKCEPRLMEYLLRHYQGPTQEMVSIWKAAKNEELDTSLFEENLLGQMLFAESYVAQADALFASYYQHGMNRVLIRAYLSYSAYKYLLFDREISRMLLSMMEREVSFEENEVCTLALLKAYSCNDKLDEKQLKFVEYKLHGIMKKGFFFPFFRKFAFFVSIPSRLLERYYIEYRANPRAKVKIHYLLGDHEDFVTEEMKNQYGGIFVKDFLLFEADELQYYITEELDGKEKLTESATFVMSSELTENQNSRFDRLNLIISSHQMQQDTTTMDLLENYLRLEYQTERLFKGIE